MASWIREFAWRESADAELPSVSRGPAVGWGRGIFGDRGFLVGSAIVALLTLVALSADFIAPHDPYSQSLIRRLRPPAWYQGGSWTYPLGTDAFGRDYLSRLIHGTRISLAVGAGAAIIAGLIGGGLGLLAGHVGGFPHRLVSYLISTPLPLPP